MNSLYLIDCMKYMKDIQDNHFDLAIVDPPYGISIIDAVNKSVKSKSSMFKMTKGANKYNFDNSIPDERYFIELKRISKYQIIWGGNYFLDYLGKTNGFAIWDKMNGTNPMADAELAWTNFDKTTRIFRMHHFSKGYGEKIHVNQKPVALYKWLLTNYAKPGDKLLDTHSGSGSFRIAAYDMGFDLDSCELDKDYFTDNEMRYQRHIQQQELFKPEEIQENIYSQKELIAL